MIVSTALMGKTESIPEFGKQGTLTHVDLLEFGLSLCARHYVFFCQ